MRGLSLRLLFFLERVVELRTLRTQDTGHFGTSLVGPNCPDRSALVPKCPEDISDLSAELSCPIFHDCGSAAALRGQVGQSECPPSVCRVHRSCAASYVHEAAHVHLQVVGWVWGWKQVSNEPALCICLCNVREWWWQGSDELRPSISRHGACHKAVSFSPSYVKSEFDYLLSTSSKNRLSVTSMPVFIGRNVVENNVTKPSCDGQTNRKPLATPAKIALREILVHVESHRWPAALLTLTSFRRGGLFMGATYFEDACQQSPVWDVTTIMQFDNGVAFMECSQCVNNPLSRVAAVHAVHRQTQQSTDGQT